jgi:hypothetical protein
MYAGGYNIEGSEISYGVENGGKDGKINGEEGGVEDNTSDENSIIVGQDDNELEEEFSFKQLMIKNYL